MRWPTIDRSYDCGGCVDLGAWLDANVRFRVRVHLKQLRNGRECEARMYRWGSSRGRDVRRRAPRDSDPIVRGALRQLRAVYSHAHPCYPIQWRASPPAWLPEGRAPDPPPF